MSVVVHIISQEQGCRGRLQI